MQEYSDEPDHPGARREGAHRVADSQSGSSRVPGDVGEAATRPTGNDQLEAAVSAHRRQPFRTVQYQRTFLTTRHRAYDAIVRVVELLQYPRSEEAAAAEVRFSALRRTVIARAVAADQGHSAVVVEFTSLSWTAIGGSALVILPGVLLGALVNVHDAYFAKGFLDNVQRVLEGRRVGRDSARFPGMNALRGILEIAER